VVPSALVNQALKTLLERAYQDFHTRYHRANDPISLVHDYSEPGDQEVVAFFCALLAYGNVKSILSSCRRVLKALGPSPRLHLLEGGHLDGLNGFYHRFTTADDLFILAHWITQALRSHGSLEDFFYGDGTLRKAPMKSRLSEFVQRLTSQSLPPGLLARKQKRARNLRYLISDPSRGSACKRLNMFLRWVVRPSDGIDLGIWRRLHTQELMLPIDTHLLQTLRALRWVQSKQATWRVVEIATEKLRQLSPDDPIRYDFALCHLSMSGNNIKRYKIIHV